MVFPVRPIVGSTVDSAVTQMASNRLATGDHQRMAAQYLAGRRQPHWPSGTTSVPRTYGESCSGSAVVHPTGPRFGHCPTPRDWLQHIRAATTRTSRTGEPACV